MLIKKIINKITYLQNDIHEIIKAKLIDLNELRRELLIIETEINKFSNDDNPGPIYPMILQQFLF